MNKEIQVYDGDGVLPSITPPKVNIDTTSSTVMPVTTSVSYTVSITMPPPVEREPPAWKYNAKPLRETSRGIERQIRQRGRR